MPLHITYSVYIPKCMSLHITCYILHTAYYILHITYYMSHVHHSCCAGNGCIWHDTCTLSCYILHTTCYTLHVTCAPQLLRWKWLRLRSGFESSILRSSSTRSSSVSGGDTCFIWENTFSLPLLQLGEQLGGWWWHLLCILSTRSSWVRNGPPVSRDSLSHEYPYV